MADDWQRLAWDMYDRGSEVDTPDDVEDARHQAELTYGAAARAFIANADALAQIRETAPKVPMPKALHLAKVIHPYLSPLKWDSPAVDVRTITKAQNIAAAVLAAIDTEQHNYPMVVTSVD